MNSLQIFELLSEDIVIALTCPAYLHPQGADALRLRTAASSLSVKTLKDMNLCTWGQF